MKCDQTYSSNKGVFRYPETAEKRKEIGAYDGNVHPFRSIGDRNGRVVTNPRNFIARSTKADRVNPTT